jgi:hypothetical protein
MIKPERCSLVGEAQAASAKKPLEKSLDFHDAFYYDSKYI